MDVTCCLSLIVFQSITFPVRSFRYVEFDKRHNFKCVLLNVSQLNCKLIKIIGTAV